MEFSSSDSEDNNNNINGIKHLNIDQSSQQNLYNPIKVKQENTKNDSNIMQVQSDNKPKAFDFDDLQNDQQDDQENNNNNGMQQEEDNQKKVNIQNLQQVNRRFEDLVVFFEQISTTKSSKKSRDTKRFFEEFLFKTNRDPHYTHSVLRLILPNIDRERGNYNVKEKILGDLIVDALSLGDQIKNRFRHFKNTSFHPHDSPTGDFGEVIFYNLKDFCGKNRYQLSCGQLNTYLNQMVTAVDKKNQVDIMRDMIRKCTATQVKWICRIILKDLKIGVGHEKALKFFHPDALEYYNATSSLYEVCKEFVSLEHRLQNILRLFHPIRPMLSDKKQMHQLSSILENKQFVIETKFDGERIQCHFDQDKIMFFSRNSNDYTHVYGRKMAEIVRQNVIKTHSCILDGEMVVVDKENNQTVQFGMNKTIALTDDHDADMRICYKVFDILYVKGFSGEEVVTMNSITLEMRKKILKNIITEKKNEIEIVQGYETQDFDDIAVEFKEAIQRNEEGIIIKQMDSYYVPNERSSSWIKMKGDYFEGLTDTLDLLIIGAYFGNQSYRTQQKEMNSDWTDNLTHFLLGVPLKTDKDNPQQSCFYPFCKVGTGYTGTQLQELRNTIRQNWINISNINSKFQSNIPGFIYQNWNPPLDDRPDAFIKNPKDSKIIEVKAAEIIRSHTWPTNFTLRFPRVEKIRYNKDWFDCMSLQELNDYTTNLKRKRADSQSEGEGEEGAEGDQQGKKKKGKNQGKNRKGMRLNEVISWFQDTDTTNVEVVSNLFQGMEFCIINLKEDGNKNSFSKQFLEEQIVRYGGKKVQNESEWVTHYIAELYDFKVDTIVNTYNKNIFYPKFLIDCITKSKVVENAPRYFLYQNDQLLLENAVFFDRYGDSYLHSVDRESLKDIFKMMNIQDIDTQNQRFTDQKLEIKNSVYSDTDQNNIIYCLYDPNGEYMKTYENKKLRASICGDKQRKFITKLSEQINYLISYQYTENELTDIQEFLADNTNIEIISINDVWQQIGKNINDNNENTDYLFNEPFQDIEEIFDDNDSDVYEL